MFSNESFLKEDWVEDERNKDSVMCYSRIGYVKTKNWISKHEPRLKIKELALFAFWYRIQVLHSMYRKDDEDQHTGSNKIKRISTEPE